MELPTLHDALLEQAKELFTENQVLIDQLNELLGKDINIPNISITFNNKLVEIMNIFKNHDVDFDHSELRIIIYYELVDILYNSLELLKKYILSLEKIFNIKRKLTGKRNFINKILHSELYEEIDKLVLFCEELISMYKDKDSELFNYTIEERVPAYVLNHPEAIDNILEDINYSLSKEQIIHNCNVDLKKLGCDEMIDNNDSYIDYSKQDKYVNSINLDFDIYDIVTEKIDLFNQQFQNYPFIKHSIDEFLLDYLERAIEFYKDCDWGSYLLIRNKVNNFNFEDCLEEVIGKRIGFCQYIQSIDMDLDHFDYRNELISLGYQDRLIKIEDEANNRKYFQYGKDQYEKLFPVEDSSQYTKKESI